LAEKQGGGRKRKKGGERWRFGLEESLKCFGIWALI